MVFSGVCDGVGNFVTRLRDCFCASQAVGMMLNRLASQGAIAARRVTRLPATTRQFSALAGKIDQFVADVEAHLPAVSEPKRHAHPAAASTLAPAVADARHTTSCNRTARAWRSRRHGWRRTTSSSRFSRSTLRLSSRTCPWLASTVRLLYALPFLTNEPRVACADAE